MQQQVGKDLQRLARRGQRKAVAVKRDLQMAEQPKLETPARFGWRCAELAHLSDGFALPFFAFSDPAAASPAGADVSVLRHRYDESRSLKPFLSLGSLHVCVHAPPPLHPVPGARRPIAYPGTSTARRIPNVCRKS